MSSTNNDLSFFVEFDNPARIYYPGQLVRAKITSHVRFPVAIRCIQAAFVGAAWTHWEEEQMAQNPQNPDGEKVKIKKPHDGNEEYYRMTFNLAGVKNGAEIRFQPGQNVYYSECQLPRTLPSTFSHKLGGVKYEVHITADLPGGNLAEHKEAFTVHSPLDLNAFPHLKESIKAEDHKTFGCCCWASDPLTLVLNLPARGFVITEPIPVSIETNNQSDVDIESIQVKLYEKLVFHTQNPADQKKERREIASSSFGAVPKSSNKVYSGKITIPTNTQLSNLNHCGIIECKYLVEATAVASGLHMDLSVDHEITLGSIPFNAGGGVATTNYPTLPSGDSFTQNQQNFAPSYPASYPAGPQPSPGTTPYPAGPQTSPGMATYPAGPPASPGNVNVGWNSNTPTGVPAYPQLPKN